MAKIKMGMMMTDASGKLGGQVFSKNRGGSYVRTKVTPINPQTTAQSFIRGVFASISSAWSSLTEAGRQSFNNFVSDYATTDVFGDIRNPSGKNLHQKLNQNLAISGQLPIAVCVLPLPVPFANVIGAQFVNPLNVNLGYSGDLIGSKIVIWATPPLSQGTRFVKNRLRQILSQDGFSDDTINVAPDYNNKFGAIGSGDNIFFAVRVINSNGQASPLEIVKMTV